jgi:hypothetical protein
MKSKKKKPANPFSVVEMAKKKAGKTYGSSQLKAGKSYSGAVKKMRKPSGVR